MDPFSPTLLESDPVQPSLERLLYIRMILDKACSDSRFVEKAYASILLVLTADRSIPSEVTSLNPSTVVLGSESFDIHVMGKGFTPESVIIFNGFEEPTTFVSDTELTTGVNMPLWQAPAVVPIQVQGGNGVMSNSMDFSFTESTPAALSTSKSFTPPLPPPVK
jgi:hypothetical protein